LRASPEAGNDIIAVAGVRNAPLGNSTKPRGTPQHRAPYKVRGRSTDVSVMMFKFMFRPILQTEP